MDEKSELILLKVYPDLAVRFRRVVADMLRLHGKQLALVEGMRSIAQQWIYWMVGRKQDSHGGWIKIGPTVTNAFPGESKHHYGLALDAKFAGPVPYPKDESIWDEYGRIVKGYGLVWGGDWNGNDVADKDDFDKVHCEINYSMNTQQIADIYHLYGLNGVWAACNERIA